MTVNHYIASSRKLPTGSFGQNPVQLPISATSKIKSAGLKQKKIKKNTDNLTEQYIKVFKKEEDFKGITVFDLEGYEEIKEKFNNPLLYHLYCDNFRISYKELFKYINDNLHDNEQIEMYTCLDGDELKEKDSSLDIVVNLKTNQFNNKSGTFKLKERDIFEDLSERFWFRERQYVVVTKG